jgi:hypothetical protein
VRRQLGTISRLGLILLMAMGTGAEVARAYNPFNFGNPAFCEPREPARDFGFSRLPAIREVPLDGQLPFARPNVNIYGGAGFGTVFTKRSSFGYGFSEENYSGTVRLGWTVTAQVWQLGQHGKPVREVGSESLYIGELDAADQPHIAVDTPGRRGFYRFDLQFADKDGGQLGSYSAYFKVARPFWKARLALDRRAYRPGQLVISRPENRGTESMSYGEDFGVQRWQDGRWASAPELLPQAWFLWLGYGGPGSPGRCSAMLLPRDVAPGRYRIVKQVTELVSGRRDPVHNLIAAFLVRQ